MREMNRRGTQPASVSADRRVAGLAAQQYGVVARRQLRALGLSDRAITQRVAAGRLQPPLHRGVFAVGHMALVARGRWMAAVLACGEHAVLSHTAAGALWGLHPSRAAIVDVTVPGTGGRQRRAGLRVHRARSLDGLTTVKDAIPVTTPGRTIIDLAARLE